MLSTVGSVPPDGKPCKSCKLCHVPVRQGRRGYCEPCIERPLDGYRMRKTFDEDADIESAVLPTLEVLLALHPVLRKLHNKHNKRKARVDSDVMDLFEPRRPPTPSAARRHSQYAMELVSPEDDEAVAAFAAELQSAGSVEPADLAALFRQLPRRLPSQSALLRALNALCTFARFHLALPPTHAQIQRYGEDLLRDLWLVAGRCTRGKGVHTGWIGNANDNVYEHPRLYRGPPYFRLPHFRMEPGFCYSVEAAQKAERA